MKDMQSTDSFEREDFGDVTVMRVRVTMLRDDEATAALFQKIDSLVEEAGRSRLVLNFDRVVFLASVGIGRVVSLLHKVRKAGGKLLLCKVNQAIDDINTAIEMMRRCGVYLPREMREAYANAINAQAIFSLITERMDGVRERVTDEL